MASPALAPPDVKDVTLSLFAGLKTDIAPSDIPEGLSGDTQDGIYLPGDWQSRPCLSRLYAAGVLTAGTTVLYEKTYVQPNDVPFTLILTSDGKLWAELLSSPGVVNQISQVTPGLYAQSVTEFGREYIAFSDLLHGQGVPLQYDGTNLDRVTMDGPGAGPAVADFSATYTISTAVMFTPQINVTLSMVGLVATAILPTFGNPNGLILANDQVEISGASVAGYNGVQTVTARGVDNLGNSYVQFLLAAPLAPATGATCKFFVGFYATTAPIAGLTTFTDAQVVTANGVSVAGYNGIFTFRGFGSGSIALYIGVDGLANGAGGTLGIGGFSSIGVHQVVCMWLDRQGALSKPSPPVPFYSSGNSEWQATNLPIGPANVVARVLGFTGSGGDNFFIIPANSFLPNTSSPGGAPILTQSTVVPDNTSTSFTFNVPDNSLFAAVPIDVIGNDLFDQVVLGPVLGFFAFASRLSCWGDYNKVENFLNMGFCGGYLSGVLTTPLGWTVVTAGGTLVNGGSWASGMSWQITGDGSGNKKGRLTQSAYQDIFGDAIISPNTFYQVRFWAKASAAGLAGTCTISLTSVSTGFSSTASVAISTFSTVGALTPFFALNNETPATIPADLILSIYETNLNNAATIIIGELEFVFALNPFRDNLSRWSYTLNPEAFAQTTGNLGPSDDESPIRCFALLRQSTLLETAEGVHIFSDTPAEPDEWNVNQLTRAVGGASVRSGDPGKFGTGDAAEDWALVAGKNGVYLFAGAEFWKVSQEISRGALPQAQDPRPTWDDINWAAQQTIVAKNDPAARRAYFAVPINGALTPNKIAVLDYREMDTATQIAGAPPLHITIQGKMKSSDLTRKWSWWNISANDLEILVRPGNQRQLYIAGGNGQAVGVGGGFGNIYSLDPAKLTDDDYGAIAPYYTTYFFTDHDQEQALGIGSDLKLVKRIHAFVAGVGMVTITPIVNSLYNFMPNLSPRILVGDTNASNFLASDLEWTTVGIRGNRIAFRIAVQPLPGTTDVQIRLQKFVVAMMKDPVVQFRQSGV